MAAAADSEKTKVEMLAQWAEIVIERWQRGISRPRRGRPAVDTGHLLKSFTSQVVSDADGDPQKVVFTFAYYGRFVDMGVGRGVPIEKVPTSHREPVPWYDKRFKAEVNKLAELLAERYGREAVIDIKRVMEFNTTY